MSVLSDGLLGWLRPKASETEDEQPQSASMSTTGGEGDQEPVVVWVASNQLEAQIIQGRLTSEGIPAIIRGEALGAIYGLTTGTLAECAILVPAPLAAKAEKILEIEEISEPAEDEPEGE
ncbi:MAG: DUF2007 domain-containing protein [Caldilineaceae bacterium]